MTLRFLFGPERQPAQRFPQLLRQGCVASFTPEHFAQANSWEDLLASAPPGFQPDFLVLDLQYQVIPPWTAAAPLPLVCLAGDSSLLWHGYRNFFQADLLLCDTLSVERFHRQGLSQARAANLYGVEQVYFDEDSDVGPRDIDVLFVGNLSSVQRERLPWLQRLARLGERWNVQIITDAWGVDYRALLRRARIVFNRSARSEANRRVSECLAAGALLVSERHNREVPVLLRDGIECILYNDADLESRIEYFLAHEEERQTIARAGQARSAELSFEALWGRVLALIESEWPALQQRARNRPVETGTPALLTRVWRAASTTFAPDPNLAEDLQCALVTSPQDAELHNALGVAVGLAARDGGVTISHAAQKAGDHFRAALAHNSLHLVAGLNLVEALIGSGQDQLALTVAQQTLLALERDRSPAPCWLDAPRFPPGFDLFFTEWQKAAWDNAGNPAAEANAKRTLLRWRLHALLSTLTGDVINYLESAAVRPDLAPTRGRVGAALARAGRVGQAVPHLRAAIEANPFQAESARDYYQACLDCGDTEGAALIARDQALLGLAAPGVVDPQPWFVRPSRAGSNLKVETLAGEEFVGRFGRLDTTRAIHSFTPPADTHAVLTLLAHCKAQRILEIGTASGHMTANLTEWSGEDATVYTIGITRGMPGACQAEQEVEAPPPEALGQFKDHFRKGGKVMAITADSASFNFQRLAPLDFAFIDGAHDLDHVLSDTRNVYEVLRPGGCLVWHDFNSSTPWVQVNQALEQARLPEPIHHVSGTGVAFLFKASADLSQEATKNGFASLTSNSLPTSIPAVVWEGGIAGVHSLALVNRELCQRLLDKNVELNIIPAEFHPAMGIPEVQLPRAIVSRFRRPFKRPVDIHVRHRWPPDFRPPAEGHLVIMQPWEFGSIPRAWAEALSRVADEVWTPTKYVRGSFVEGGIPAERVAVVPHGVDISVYHPDVPPLPLKTRKKFKFLIVGGTIWRKGIDVLLDAYQKAFTSADDVCLVIKDMGNGTFYKGQTREKEIAELRGKADAPEIEYLDRSLSAQEMAALYTSCDCLVQPYRGEGFCLPIAEAMACGKPPIVTCLGASLDFCNEANAWLIPAQRITSPGRFIGGMETVADPWHAEPDVNALTELLRHAAANPAEVRTRGEAGRAHVRAHLTWDHAAAVVDQRLRELVGRPVFRFQKRSAFSTVPRRMRVSLTMIVKNEAGNLAECLRCIIDLVDEVIIVDTGSTDRTKEIAVSFGPKVKVFDFPWVDSFSAARNEALKHATGEFIFWLDADDRLDSSNREKLARLFDNLPDANVAFSLKCLCPPDPTSSFPTVVDHVRIFRNLPENRWKYRVHEQILGAVRNSGGQVIFEDVVITHIGYMDAALRARKLQRDLRLLILQMKDDPNEPFTLFNMGMVTQDLGKHEEALAHLHHCLERSHPSDSIIRKVYSLMGGSLLALERTPEAVAAYDRGLRLYADDAELLFHQARLYRRLGNPRAAEANLFRLLSTRPEAHFASTDPTLRGFRGRNELAEVLLEQGRYAEARAQFRQVLAEQPGFFPAWISLGDIAVAERDAKGLEEILKQVEQFPGGPLQANLLRGRMMLALNDPAGARMLAERLIAIHPREVGPRVILGRALRMEGQDRAAESAWRQVMVLDPKHAEMEANISELLRQRLRTEDALFEERGRLTGWVLEQRYNAACLTPSDLQEHLPVLHDLAEQCRHVTDMGTGNGQAALAFLQAQPERLVCIDLLQSTELVNLKALCGQTKVEFRRADVLACDIEETDLLFLDTRHNAAQLRDEFRLHAPKVRKFIVTHGTAAHDQAGETPGEAGVGPVIEEFLSQGVFRLLKRYENNHGLTVLERVHP